MDPMNFLFCLSSVCPWQPTARPLSCPHTACLAHCMCGCAADAAPSQPISCAQPFLLRALRRRRPPHVEHSNSRMSRTSVFTFGGLCAHRIRQNKRPGHLSSPSSAPLHPSHQHNVWAMACLNRQRRGHPSSPPPPPLNQQPWAMV